MQTLNHIGIIALNTFRESIRDKILYNIGFLAIALTLFSIVLGEWSVFDRAYVIKSTTLSVMDLSGLLISIFVGISLVQKEIQRRTVLTLLSKPISRAAFIVGKYFGLLAVVAVHLCLLTGIYYCILWVTNSSPTVSLLSAIYLIFCEMAIVIAVALLFSSFSSTVLSALFTLGVYFAGHLSDQLLEMGALTSKEYQAMLLYEKYLAGMLSVIVDAGQCSAEKEGTSIEIPERNIFHHSSDDKKEHQ